MGADKGQRSECGGSSPAKTAAGKSTACANLMKKMLKEF
jgi:hypothetical protein